MHNNELLTSFLQEAQEVVGELDAGLAELHDPSDSGMDQSSPAQDEYKINQLSILAHRMRGSSALYGYPQLSTLASLMERVLNSQPHLHGVDRQSFIGLLDTIMDIMKQGIMSLNQGGTDHQLGLAFARQGGAELLEALVNAHPKAFELRVTPHFRHPDEEDEEEVITQVISVENDLQSFLRENGEVWEYFAPEIREHLGFLRQQLDLKHEGDITVMFRAAHTIKGSSYMVGLNSLGDFAHKTEDLLGAVREDAVALEGQALKSLIQATDLMEDILLVAEGSNNQVATKMETLALEMAALATGEQIVPNIATPVTTPKAPTTDANIPAPVQADTPNTSIRVPASQLEGLMDQLSEVVAARSQMTQTLNRMEDLQNAMSDSQQRFQRTVRDFEERYLNPDMVRAADGDTRSGSSSMGLDMTQQFAELEFDSYNDLNILSRSITELSADFGEIRRRFTDAIAELQDHHERSGKLIRRLRLDMTQTSRVPFNSATTRMRRWARERQEDFDLEILGEDILLESSIAQRLAEPLMHLLTNAVHHGLDEAHERQKLGKSPQGKVTIHASEDRGFLEVSVTDDGRGLDVGRIRERALERGLHSAQELNNMRDADVARLILLPGLSTAEAVGTVTGRGVGMDVVATNVRQLGGELLINTRAGKGTTFTLRLPTTQRVLDVLEVQLGHEEQKAAFAANNVITLTEIRASDIMISDQGPQIYFEGSIIPLVDLCEIWGFPNNETIRKLVILNSISGPVAMQVREFGRIEESSVTPPSNVMSQLEYLSGMALSSSGGVLPILDPAGLGRLARRPQSWFTHENQEGFDRARRILLVDDSLSVRRLVGRMLERGGYQIQTANDGQEALDIVQLDSEFDAIISDLEMPRMNGYELLTAVRNRAGSEEIPVMIMTTRAGEKHQRLAFQMGANDYFTKPVNESLLLRRLGTLLSGDTQAGDTQEVNP